MLTTTQTNRDYFAASAPTATLRLVFSAKVGVLDVGTVALTKRKLAIGRGVSSREGIGLTDDNRASRVHAQVCLAANDLADRPTCHIIDAQSKNGTFVNGRRITECEIFDGDLIRIGDSFLVLRMESPIAADEKMSQLLGKAPTICALRQELLRVAPSAAAVLLLGESGTGKELAAKELHELRRASGRSGPFVAVNCAAIPETLAESQLFGHVAGAYSDARTASDGYFRAAQGGTLLLDEVGELPLGLQAKLLRAIEEKAVVPVGSTRPIACDVRLIAATHRDLGIAMKEGRFRGDLLARLSALPIELPPLRARREDILGLLTRLWRGPLPRLTPRLVEALLLYDWPFNVRELVQLTAFLSLHATPGAELDLPLVVKRLGLGSQPELQSVRTRAASGPPESPIAPVAGVATNPHRLQPAPMSPPIPKELLIRLLAENRGIISRVASAVGRSRKQVYRWMEQYQIARGSLDGEP